MELDAQTWREDMGQTTGRDVDPKYDKNWLGEHQKYEIYDEICGSFEF